MIGDPARQYNSLAGSAGSERKRDWNAYRPRDRPRRTACAALGVAPHRPGLGGVVADGVDGDCVLAVRVLVLHIFDLLALK